MTAESKYIRDVSLHLSRTLGEIGLNTRTVKRRRDTLLYKEQIDNMSYRLRGIKNYHYNFGSQTEGATTPGLKSDLDTLVLVHGVNVIQDWTDWERGKVNLLILQEDTAPGYCRLQALSSDIPTARQIVLPSQYFTYDDSRRVIVTNSWIQNEPVPGYNSVRNGPAQSVCDRPGIVDDDFVLAFACKSWPKLAKEFTRRQSRSGWPTQHAIQQAVQQGVFLVPVGYKLSPTEHLEWRLSASLAERCLMFSLSIIHIKCYVVLKMLIKTFLQPRIGQCISSYHCKTAVLYCTQDADPGFWRDDNLLQCVTHCLVKLLSWVADVFCPHFIIFEENLFAGKVTAQNRGVIQCVLRELAKEIDQKLLYVQIDDLGATLQRKLSTYPSTIPVQDSPKTVVLSGWLNYERCRIIHSCFREVLLHHKHATPSTVACFVYQWIEVAKARMGLSNKHDQHVIRTVIEFLYSWMGSLLASISLSRHTSLPIQAIQLLYFDGKSNVASMLKLASVFYCYGDARKAGTILHRLEHYYDRNKIQPMCGCYDKCGQLSYAFCNKLFALKSRRRRATCFAPCVRYSPKEIHCVPHALRHELFRSVGDDLLLRHPVHDIWMDLAVVDCLPYLYFLQYMTHRQLRQLDLHTLALQNLDRCIKVNQMVGHIETAWNLLGQCLELEKQPDAAMACYRKSLKIRPKNNAANWHVAILCYRLISK